MRKSSLAFAAVSVMLLSGCPNLLGTSSGTTLDPKILAVTTSDQGMTTASVGLSWSGVTNAATYQIIRQVGDSSAAKLIGTTNTTSYNDNVQPNLSITYTVQAYSPSGDMIVSSNPKTVQVLDAKVGKPTGLTIDSQAASGDTIITANSSKPSLTWTAAANANAYYVTINEASNGSSNGKLVYSALTSSPNLTVGTLPQQNLDLPNFSQLNTDGLTSGKIYFVNLTSIRSDNSDLSKATAFDVSAMDTPARVGW